MKIALIGGSGLIGSRFYALEKDNFDIRSFSSSDLDITNSISVNNALKDFAPEIIIHFAGKTNVDLCEEDKIQDLQELSLEDGEGIDLNNIDSKSWTGKKSAFAINTIGTKNLCEYASEEKIKIVYISTDFVFFGDKEYYTEEDIPKPVNWYGMTKYYGELFVQNLSKENFIIARLAFPYGYKSEIKKDFVWKMVELLETSDEARFVDDQIITPTFIDDIVKSLKILLEKNASGLFHIVGSSCVSPYNAGKMIAEEFGLTKTLIGTIHLEDLYRGRARRPFKVRLKNDKLVHLGFIPKTFEEGLRRIKKSVV